MTGWWIETLVWTGLIIALVLAVRGPVGRHFGPQAAYALWLLPFLRLVMPPLVLPAWLAPAAAGSDLAAPHFATTQQYGVVMADTAAAPLGQMATATASAEPFAWGALLLAVLLSVWLGGAAGFLALRFTGYFRMRREMLVHAQPVGEAGSVRLVETPAATAPIAFGVLDKVIALPPGFMAMANRQHRDLALAHELAHHRAHDLLANMAAQQLFALHWFNPLAWLGWRAMRRDQEAACDARVIAQCGTSEKATYAAIIASFAAGPNIALAAPMACPILGEKSIIHRLRSLTMSDISPRRRFAGRALIGMAVLALPMTATITYAASLTVPNPPPSPAAPASPPGAPTPPEAPLPPQAPMMWQSADGSEFTQVSEMEGDAPNGDGTTQKTVRIIRMKHGADEDGQHQASEHKEIRIHKLESLAELKNLKELQGLKELEGLSQLQELKNIRSLEGKQIAMIVRKSMESVPQIAMSCDGEEMVKETRGQNGRQVISICTDKIGSAAIDGIREARAEIARDAEIDKETRTEILKSLDATIADLSAKD